MAAPTAAGLRLTTTQAVSIALRVVERVRCLSIHPIAKWATGMSKQIDSLWAHVTGLALKALPPEEQADYIDPKDATFIRIFQDECTWNLDAGDDLGNYTEACWFADTKEQVQNLVSGFCEEYGLDPALTIVVIEYDVCRHCGTPITRNTGTIGPHWFHAEECPKDSPCWVGNQGAEP